MGKKSKRQAAATPRFVPGSAITSKAVCKVVEELWTRLQGPSPTGQVAMWQEYDIIAGLLRTLREKQGPSPLETLAPRGDLMAGFEQWVNENGAKWDHVEIMESPGMGFGMKVTKDLQAEDKVLVVPKKIIMTAAEAKEALKPLVSQDRMLQTLSNVTMAVHLLNESYKPNSFWKPYINILPRSFTTPLYFSKEEIQMLQSSPCHVEALQQVRGIAKLFAHLHKVIRAHGDTSLPLHSVGFYYQDFIWAVSCVMSRQNEIPLSTDGKDPTLALIPLWDLCNHANGVIGTDYDPEHGNCICYATHPFKAGEEFKIFYGLRSNAELFIHQGFVYPSNKSDSVRIKLGLSSAEDPHTKKMKAQILERLGLPVSGVYHVIAAELKECPYSVQLRAFARVFTANREELEVLLSLEDGRLRRVITDQRWGPTDIKALDFLEKRCALLGKPYKTTIEEDERLLSETDSLSEGARLAILLRMCEKKMLQYASLYGGQVRMAIEKVLASQRPAGGGTEIAKGRVLEERELEVQEGDGEEGENEERPSGEEGVGQSEEEGEGQGEEGEGESEEIKDEEEQTKDVLTNEQETSRENGDGVVLPVQATENGEDEMGLAPKSDTVDGDQATKSEMRTEVKELCS